MVKLISVIILSFISLQAQAESNAPASPATPISKSMVNTLSQKVLRIKTTQANGEFIFGSGVVVADNQIITNCHVITDAASVSVIAPQANVEVVSIKPDWKHDLCLLQTPALNIAPVSIKPTQQLHYEQTVFNIGHPSFVAEAVSQQGTVQGMFPMDDSTIIRASNEFNVGASGGGLFDTEGNLVGIITLKSPGKQAYHYYMATEWVKALLAKPTSIAVANHGERPFWNQQAEQWPHFMKVVKPLTQHDWSKLKQIALTWVEKEPNNHEAWFYLAQAEIGEQAWSEAEAHLRLTISLNNDHVPAKNLLADLAKKSSKQTLALANIN